MYWHVGARGAFKAPAAVGILIYNAYSALYSDSHNYRALRASPSPFLSRLPSPSLTLSGVSLSRSHPVLSFISSPCSATLVSDYQYRRRYTVFFLSLLFSFSLSEIRRENDENSYEQYANNDAWPWPSVTAAPEFLSEVSKLVDCYLRYRILFAESNTKKF